MGRRGGGGRCRFGYSSKKTKSEEYQWGGDGQSSGFFLRDLFRKNEKKDETTVTKQKITFRQAAANSMSVMTTFFTGMFIGFGQNIRSWKGESP